MEKPKLKAEKRDIFGRKVEPKRKEGLLPANVFGKKIKSFSIFVKLSDFLETFKKAGETTLINLEIGKDEPRAVLVANIQKNPLNEVPIHVDFHQVDLKEKVTAPIPVEIEGESPAEKQGIGTVVQYLDEIEVEALPTDLPEKFVIDTSILIEVDQAVFVKDIKVDKTKVEVKVGLEEIVVKVEPPQKEEVVVAPVVEEGAEAVAPESGEEPKVEPVEGDQSKEEAKPQA